MYDVWYVIFRRSRFPLKLRWEASMGPIFGPGLLGGIEPCSFSSLLELVSELLLSTAGVWSAAPCPAQPSLQAPRSFISCLCASEWRMYCPCSLFISIIFMPFKKWKVWFKVKIFYRPFLIYNPSLLTFEWHFLWQNFYWITFGGSVETPGAGAGEAPILARSGGWVLSLQWAGRCNYCSCTAAERALSRPRRTTHCTETRLKPSSNVQWFCRSHTM